MPGRPRKVVSISTGNISKEEKNARKRQEKELKLDRDALVAPSWLSPRAAEEFSRVAAEFAKIDILDNLDLQTLAIYADAYDKFVTLKERLDEEGEVITVEGVKSSYQKVNPALTAQSIYVDRIYKASAKLGMATTDRLKLVVPTEEEKKKENPYFRFLSADG